jgi:hypothetical protein
MLGQKADSILLVHLFRHDSKYKWKNLIFGFLGSESEFAYRSPPRY